MIFKGRFKLNIGFVIVVIMSLIGFSTNSLWLFKSVYFYIGSFILISIPLLFVKSKRLVITDTNIETSYFFGLYKENFKWEEIEEALLVTNSKGKSQYKRVNAIVDLLLTETYQLIISNNEPINIQTGDYINGKLIYQELIKHTHFVKPTSNAKNRI